MITMMSSMVMDRHGDARGNGKLEPATVTLPCEQLWDFGVDLEFFLASLTLYRDDSPLSNMNPLLELDEKRKDPSLVITDTLGSPELGISTLTSSADPGMSPAAASEAATASAQVIQPAGVTVSLQLSPSMIDIGSITIFQSGCS